MKIVGVKLNKHSYKVVIGKGAINYLSRLIKTLGIGTDAYIITNRRVKKLYGKTIAANLKRGGINFDFKLIPDSEESKSIKIASNIIAGLAKFGIKRKPFLIALGGGVIGDVSGFAASIYKRGIPYIQVPTTLLAQVDSSIGGKTAVDLTSGKNLVGAFYQPRLVLSDIKFLKSLTSRQVKSGLSEIIKYSIIKDKALFNYINSNASNIKRLDTGALEFMVSRCSKIKAEIVGQDEREEKGIRTILNFGHTIGHAIETASKFKKYNHGEAVAMGMIASSYISYKKGFISKGLFESIRSVIRKAGLPLKLKNVPSSRIIKAHYSDKKFSGKTNRFVLIKGIGKAVVVKNIGLALIKEAIKQIN
ncbi:MAG: 3-dehydroquinate synthase [Candidatus Omnitrophota bacterium]|jgi:3-dehydroquinate synthase|nr:MAG: 3-dehydroquinate synthase [Candidatus Omnitrophota bacterium]